jgi:hypothetical protein
MALMTPEQTAAELQRKKNLGIQPTNAANMAQYNALKPQVPAAAPSVIPPGGGIKNLAPGAGAFSGFGQLKPGTLLGTPGVAKPGTLLGTPGGTPSMVPYANTAVGVTPNTGTGYNGTPSADALKWASTDAYYNQAGGGSLKGAGAADQDRINGVAGLKTQEDELFRLINQKKIEEINKGYGLTDDWAQKVLGPLYSQVYDLEDQMNQKYGINGASDNFGFTGTNRAATGHQTIDQGTGKNIAQSRDAFLYQQDLMKQGIDPQKAYDLANKKFPPTQGVGAGVSDASGVASEQGNASSNDFSKDYYLGRKFGGADKYAADQNKRYAAAYAAGDTALMDKLIADSKRVGYTLNDPTGAGSTGSTGSTGSGDGSNVSGNGGDGVPTGTSANDLINGAYENDYNAGLQALRKARDTQLQGLLGQETQANQGAYDNRNNNDLMSMMQMKALKEQMASQGINGGDSITAQIGNDTTRQNGANAINRDLANTLQDLSQRRALINDNAAADELALQQQLQGVRDGRLLDQSNADRSFELQKGQLTGYLNTSDMQKLYDEVNQAKTDYASATTPAERDAAHKRADDARAKLAAMNANVDAVGSNVTLGQSRNNQGKYGIQTLAARESDRNFDYTTGRDKVADEQWNKTFDYNAGRDKLADDRYNSETDYAHGRDAIADKRYDSETSYSHGRDKVADAQWMKEFNNRVEQQGIDNALSWANYSLSQDNNDLAWIKYDDELSNGSGSGKTVSGATAGDMLSSSLRKTVGVDPDTGMPKYGTISDPTTREKAFIDAWNASGVAPGQDTLEMLSKAGYTSKEIASFKKKYPKAFQ